MNDQQQVDYDRISKAISYISQNFQEQPNLDDVAAAVNLSPYHFQRMFTEWAGISPKKFLQYISIEYAKTLLVRERATLLNTSFETGLSGTGRLHDLFIKIDGMTPAEYKNGGEGLKINYVFAGSPFGDLIIASTAKGVCHMAFEDDENGGAERLKEKFPKAVFTQRSDMIQRNALSIFQHGRNRMDEIKLHLKGTDFQLKVWEALLKIPMGELSTYGEVAEMIGKSGASRAVGTAIGGNPVAYLIPCHRVIRSTGVFGGYMWGNARKKAIIGWEGAKVNEQRPTELRK